MGAEYILQRIKFDRKVGDNYYFLAGFYNEGLTLPSFGLGGLPDQHSLLNLLTVLPPRFYTGQYIGTYEVPTTLCLRSAKGAPWISDFGLVEDLLISWQSLLGYFFLDWYEVLYTPTEEDTLPEPYLTAHEDSEPAAVGGNWTLPINESDWPADEGEFSSIQVAHSVRRAGCIVASPWLSVFSGSMSEWHMLALIGSYPKEPEEPDIEVRWWEDHLPSTMKSAWGAFDARYPEYDFDGWNNIGSGTPFDRLIRVVEGAATTFYSYPVYTNTSVIIPYLSGTAEGETVQLRLPFADEEKPAFFFPDPYIPKHDGLIPNILTAIITILPKLKQDFMLAKGPKLGPPGILMPLGGSGDLPAGGSPDLPIGGSVL